MPDFRLRFGALGEPRLVGAGAKPSAPASVHFVRRALFAVLALGFFAPQLGRAESEEELVESEVQCEEAAAQLDSCCGDLPSALHCDYRAPMGCSCNECEDPGSRPMLSERLRECLDRLTCEQIVTRGYCDDLFMGRGLGRVCEGAP